MAVENLPANAGDIRDMGSIPGSGNSPGGGHGNLLQCSCLENPMDRGAWWAAVRGVTKSQTQLSDFTLNFIYIHSLVAQMVVSSCNSGDPGLIPGLERPPGEENGYHSNILAWNSMDRGI